MLEAAERELKKAKKDLEEGTKKALEQIRKEAKEAKADIDQGSYDKAADLAIKLSKLTAEAAAAVTAAVAAVVAATVAIGIALAALLALNVGVGYGQLILDLWDWCIDPLCNISFSVPMIGQTYQPASDQEVETMTLEDARISSGVSVKRSDFSEAGWNYAAQGTALFVNLARWVAADNADRPAEVIAAMPGLEMQLKEYAVAQAAYAVELEETFLDPPLAALASGLQDFQTAVSTIISDLIADSPEHVESISQLNAALDGFQTAQSQVQSLTFLPMVGPGGAMPDLSLSDFQIFILDCALNGVRCLPAQEIEMADYLLEAAGVFSPTHPSLGPVLADYVAAGDTGGRESALFNPDGFMTLAELLSRQVAGSVASGGPWHQLYVDISPVAQGAFSRFPTSLIQKTPIAINRQYSMQTGDELIVELVGTDYQSCVLSIVSFPASNGRVGLVRPDLDCTTGSPNWSLGLRSYVPEPGFTGVDSFEYNVQDEDSNFSLQATVVINVTAAVPPVSAPTLMEQTSSISNQLESVWSWDAKAEIWDFYITKFANTPGINTLPNLEAGKGYWIKLDQDASLLYESKLYDLASGWNLIGWLGN